MNWSKNDPFVVGHCSAGVPKLPSRTALKKGKKEEDVKIVAEVLRTRDSVLLHEEKEMLVEYRGGM